MAKRKRTVTEKKIEKYIKEGRGTGELKDYKPWLKIQDVPSLGLSSRIKGRKTNRVHHLLSNLELGYFYILDWRQTVHDIKEQFPLLPREETIEIADQLGIKYPVDPKTNEPIVITTDFLVTEIHNSIYIDKAFSVKPAEALKSQRTLEKLEIERVYWKRRDIEWKIVTEKNLPRSLINNIRFVHSHKDLSYIPHVTNTILKNVEKLLFQKLGENQKLAKATKTTDNQLTLPAGTSLAIVRYLIANRIWLVNMGVAIKPNEPIVIIRNKKEN